MQVKSNKLSDIVPHYSNLLIEKFNDNEVHFQLYWLLESVLDIPSSQIPLNLDKRLSESDLLKVHFGVKELLKGKPIQYVVGNVEFGDVMLKVNEDVLIPRPETEELVTLIQNHSFKPTSILDACSGSGAIAIALQKHFNVPTSAIEYDAGALALSLDNAVLNKASIGFMKMDLLDSNGWEPLELSFDLIVSNPPYVREQEKKMMHENVLLHEPHLALFVSDEDPLIFYRTLLSMSKSKLEVGGHMWLEINEYIAKDTAALFKSDFQHVEIIQDFRDKDRFLHIY